MTRSPRPFLRARDGHHARVTFEELFFDLVYVFLVTQLGHKLLQDLSIGNLTETIVLWFAVWLGWQYTCWFTNWFDPENPPIRAVLVASMLLALVMAAALPDAFGGSGLIFAISYVGIQVGRTVFTVSLLGPDHVLAPNWRRILGWLLISAAFWIGGAFAPEGWRALLWAIAVACEYVSPMFGFALPGFGRSNTREWTIEGAHLTERCHLFVIVALGETLLATGASLAHADAWNAPVLLALLATFLGTLAMWWLYFGTSSKDATAAITHSDDPGRIGSYFHYVHVILIGGIIATAVGNDLVMAHPHHAPSLAQILVLTGGPAIYLFGSAVYKKVVYGAIPLSHLAGILALGALIPAAAATNLLAMGWLTTGIVLGVCLWESRTSLHSHTGDPATP